MDHRDKRPRLADDQGSADTLEANRSPTDLASAMATKEGSVATGSVASEVVASTVQDTSTPQISQSTTMLDKSIWQGWAEIENDPAVFNVMLREWGVHGIQVNEVVPLEAIYDSPATTTYGLIFLSRYSTNKGDKQTVGIPAGLWFANQTSTYSCGTVALMNIVSNLENVNLGPQITQFIAITADMSSKDKGLALDSFEHVRQIHNSFATLIDMKSVDRRLQLDVKAHTQKQKQAALKKPTPTPTTTTTSKAHLSKKSKKKRYILSDDEATIAAAADEATVLDTDSGFHFIAYLPAHHHLWRMDGLERQPESLGTLAPGDATNWLDMAVVELGAQLQSAAAQNIEFSLLSLVAAREDDGARVEENVAAARLREDWGPALAELVRGVAERG